MYNIIKNLELKKINLALFPFCQTSKLQDLFTLIIIRCLGGVSKLLSFTIYKRAYGNKFNIN